MSISGNEVQKLQFCPVCKIHTPHEQLVNMYADRCIKCNSHNSMLMRMQAEQFSFKAPDGNGAVVVENTPTHVTYYVAEGSHAGYYEYDKRTKQKVIRAL